MVPEQQTSWLILCTENDTLEGFKEVRGKRGASKDKLFFAKTESLFRFTGARQLVLRFFIVVVPSSIPAEVRSVQHVFAVARLRFSV